MNSNTPSERRPDALPQLSGTIKLMSQLIVTHFGKRGVGKNLTDGSQIRSVGFSFGSRRREKKHFRGFLVNQFCVWHTLSTVRRIVCDMSQTIPKPTLGWARNFQNQKIFISLESMEDSDTFSTQELLLTPSGR